MSTDAVQPDPIAAQAARDIEHYEVMLNPPDSEAVAALAEALTPNHRVFDHGDGTWPTRQAQDILAALPEGWTLEKDVALRIAESRRLGQEYEQITRNSGAAAVERLREALTYIADLPPAMGQRSDAMDLLDEARDKARAALAATAEGSEK